MVRLTEIKNTKFVAILYGKPKPGKTVLASQFPSPWFVDLEKGLMSVIAMKRTRNLDFDFDVTQIDDKPTEDPDFIKLCGKAFVRQDPWLKLNKLTQSLIRHLPKDATLVVDSLTKAGEFLLDHIKSLTGRKQLQIQDWGTFKDEMMAWYQNLFLGKCNVIVIAHEQVIKDELTGAIERTLLLPGQSASRLPSVCDEFWYLVKDIRGKNVKRVLKCDGDRITSAGSRSWITDMEDPTYAKIKPFL